MYTFVIAKDGTRLMPTSNVKKVRKLLRTNRAVIYKHKPFTIQLLYDSGKGTQPIELTEDTGYQTIGVSIKSEKHEYVSEEHILLKDEVEHHNNSRKCRRTRRNRLRHREVRFDNRKSTKKEGWLAPSLGNKKNCHLQIFKIYNKVMPISKAVLEIGQFDTQILKAIEEGKPLPKGLDYQHGPLYEHDTLREAVFSRDNYRCICCEKSAIKDGVILRIHHVGFWHGDRTNRLSNLASVCTSCHTSKNHQPDGKLYGMKSIIKNFKGAAFMNSVKFKLYEEFKTVIPTRITYGSITKRNRLDLNIEKTHANDAYCIGEFRPKHRAETITYQKRRRNNRILSKFYDAKYIDIRDGKTKGGKDLSCGRTNRRELRNLPKNERIFRGQKVSNGKIILRTIRSDIRPHDYVYTKEHKYKVLSSKNRGKQLKLEGGVLLTTSKVIKVVHTNGWAEI